MVLMLVYMLIRHSLEEKIWKYNIHKKNSKIISQVKNHKKVQSYNLRRCFCVTHEMNVCCMRTSYKLGDTMGDGK